MISIDLAVIQYCNVCQHS